MSLSAHAAACPEQTRDESTDVPIEPPSCPDCGGPLNVSQPEEDWPELLVGTCRQCRCICLIILREGRPTIPEPVRVWMDIEPLIA